MLMSFFNNHRLAVVLSATIPNLRVCASFWLTPNTQEKRDWWSTSHRCAPPGWLDKWISSLTHFLYAPLTNMNIYWYQECCRAHYLCLCFPAHVENSSHQSIPSQRTKMMRAIQTVKSLFHLEAVWHNSHSFSTQLKCKVTLFSLLHNNL